METDSPTTGSDDVDPKTQLETLKRVREAVAVEAWMPKTPLWHAPLLGLGIAAFLLYTQGSGLWSIAGAIVASVVTAFGIWDTRRRQGARPRRLGKPMWVFGFYAVIVLGTMAILMPFAAAVAAAADRWPDDVAMLLLTLTGGWIAASAVFAIGIASTNALRDQWVGSSQ